MAFAVGEEDTEEGGERHASPGGERPWPGRGAFEFGALTGWRIPSEVWTLTWDRVDMKDRSIRLPMGTTKNKEGRTLYFGKLPALVAL